MEEKRAAFGGLDLSPTRSGLLQLHHSREVFTEHLQGIHCGILGQGLRNGSRHVTLLPSPQGLQGSYSEEYLRTLLCRKKLESR